MKNKNLLIVITVMALIALFSIGAYFYKSSERERIATLAQDRQSLFERPHSPVLGNNLARVTLVEFLDPECETCRDFYPLVKDLLKEHGGAVRLVVRYAPFHGNSKFAIQLLEAARKQGKYWETLELFFKHQPAWGDHHSPKPELLWTYLPEVRLDIEKIRQDMLDPEIAKMIEQDISDGQKLGVRQTPSFFVNGKPLQNFGYEQLRQLIQSEM
jgi:protein-disulfide isomerase